MRFVSVVAALLIVLGCDDGTLRGNIDAMAPFACGDMKCPASQVCFYRVIDTEVCLHVADGGCPPGAIEGRFSEVCPEGSAICDQLVGPRCLDLFGTCNGPPTCACLSQVCSYASPSCADPHQAPTMPVVCYGY
jgi:hypothetical protein